MTTTEGFVVYAACRSTTDEEWKSITLSSFEQEALTLLITGSPRISNATDDTLRNIVLLISRKPVASDKSS